MPGLEAKRMAPREAKDLDLTLCWIGTAELAGARNKILLAFDGAFRAAPDPGTPRMS